jgi:hypothetical protein
MRENATKQSEMAAGFPHLRARLGGGADTYGAAPMNTFEFGLQAILDGLETRLASRSA